MVLQFGGMVGFLDKASYKAAIAAVTSCTRSNIEIDLSGASAIDSGGIGMLLLLNDKAKSVGNSLQIFGSKGAVGTALSRTKISQIIPFI